MNREINFGALGSTEGALDVTITALKNVIANTKPDNPELYQLQHALTWAEHARANCMIITEY